MKIFGNIALLEIKGQWHAVKISLPVYVGHLSA